MPATVRRYLYPAVILAAVVAAYWPSFSGVFVFDDIEAIVENPTIRDLGDIGAVLSPPFESGQTVGGRPFLNLTLAANYAIGGPSPRGYHAVNLAVHALAALVLFGLVRRAVDGSAWLKETVAFGAAMLWALHPLQTESVTYVIQRAEALMGLFYLLTLYGFVRAASAASAQAGGWLALSVTSCFLGMATKEVMASAPLIVLIYDRVFVGGSFTAALRRRPLYYAALASSWLLLGALVYSTRNRGGSMGLGLSDVGWGEYALTQFPAIVHYLRLAVWPSPLIFDYGAQWIERPWSVLPAALLVIGLAGVAVGSVLRGKAWGFPAIFFFAILAPTSLVPANRQTISEHRMYLALAPLAVAAAWAAARIASGRWGSREAAPDPDRNARIAVFVATTSVAVAYGAVTFRRQAVYQSEIALWTDTAHKRPGNAFAHGNLGKALALAGRLPEAKVNLERALQIRPDLPDAHGNLGNVLMELGAIDEAIPHYEAAVRLTPRSSVVHANLGGAYFRVGRVEEGLAAYREALRLNPDYERARYNLANALGRAGRLEEAAAELGLLLRQRPHHVDARMNHVLVLGQLGRNVEALASAEEGIKTLPPSAELHNLAGILNARQGSLVAARAAFEKALSVDASYLPARDNLTKLNSTQGTPGPR